MKTMNYQELTAMQQRQPDATERALTVRPGKISIGSFSIQMQVQNSPVKMTLCLFSRHLYGGENEANSYSIVGKVTGMSCNKIEATLNADYGLGFILQDNLQIRGNEFSYSNHSTKPAGLQLKVTSRDSGEVELVCLIKLKYNLRHLQVTDVQQRYHSKDVCQQPFILMQ